MLNKKKVYKFEKLPCDIDVKQYAIAYTSEKFSEEEKKYLKPFFSNIDKPVYVITHLPEEVIGALSSRYSRSIQSIRRMFLTEYIDPIIHPEKQKDWESFSTKEKKEANDIREKFLELIKFLNTHGGIDYVVNVQRGRKFFDRWLAEYGDDSIAELGGIHLSIEGLSNIATKEIQDKRVGISPLEKSSRYVSFANKRADGKYQYIIPGEIKGTKLEKEYTEAMDLLFETYVNISEPYVEYIKTTYPKGEDETDGSFNNSRSAKRFDDIRDLLPFSTQTNVAMFGNGRAFEDLITRLMNHPLGEMRWLAHEICEELEKVVPSFVHRSKTQRGAEAQHYRNNLRLLKDELVKDVLSDVKPSGKIAKWVRLLSHTPDADIKILSSFLFSNGNGLSLSDIEKQIKKLGVKKRKLLFEKILTERKFGKNEVLRQEVRFRKVPRAFENANYSFELWGRGGDYRDLHRHRQLTQERHRFTTKWGYDLEKEVLNSPFAEKIKMALEKCEKVYKKLEKISPEVAQYAVPFGYLQHWYMNMTAREVYWLVELRTGPQGRPHYREISQQIAKLASNATPLVFQGLMTDWNNYSLSRRESEKKIEKKLKGLGMERKSV